MISMFCVGDFTSTGNQRNGTNSSAIRVSVGVQQKIIRRNLCVQMFPS